MKKKINWKQTEIITVIFLLLLVGFLLGTFPAEQGEREKIKSLYEGWYQMENGDQIPVTLPASVMTDTDGAVRLYNDTLTEKDAGKIFSSRGVQYDLCIQMGNKTLYTYQDSDFGRNTQMKGKLWADIELPEETGDESLCLIFSGKPGHKLQITAPLIGSAHAIAGQHLQDNAFSILMMLSMLGMGLIAFGLYVYMCLHEITEKRFLDAALFLLLCSLWCMTDSGLFQLYGQNISKGSVFSFYAFMLMSVPMLHFVQNTISAKRRQITKLWIAALYLNAVAQGVAFAVFSVPMIQMLLFTHILLFTGVISMNVLMWNEYREKGTYEVKLCLAAFGVLGLGGIAALILYWGFGIYWYDAVFQFGILLFIALMLLGLTWKALNDAKFRVEQTVYQRMAQEDRLTGMKNRAAFDTYLERLQIEACTYQDVLLIFAKLYELKDINDAFGIETGNEVLIGAAACIRQICEDSPGEKPECFRIGGNEFAIVILNPTENREAFESRLKQNLQKYNQTHFGKAKVSLRCGYGNLRGADGSVKNFSDWKMQADRFLHTADKSEGEQYDGI